jgi:hypothetical protein
MMIISVVVSMLPPHEAADSRRPSGPCSKCDYRSFRTGTQRPIHALKGKMDFLRRRSLCG